MCPTARGMWLSVDNEMAEKKKNKVFFFKKFVHFEICWDLLAFGFEKTPNNCWEFRVMMYRV